MQVEGSDPRIVAKFPSPTRLEQGFFCLLLANSQLHLELQTTPMIRILKSYRNALKDDANA